MKNNKYRKYLLGILTIIYIFLLIDSIIRNHYTYTFNSIIIYIAYVIVFYYQQKGTIKTTIIIDYALFITIILHSLVGHYFNVYNTNQVFDKSLHAFGTLVISLFIYQVLISLFGFYSRYKVVTFLILTSIGITLGALLENYEFILDALFKGDNQKSLLDTDLDLLFNVVGAVIAGVIAVIQKNKSI